MVPKNAKTIPDFPAYCVTSDGKIWNKKFKKIRRLAVSHNGYYQILLRKNRRAYNCRVSRIVLETFVGPCPKGMECCHNNGDKTDNHLENLRWDTKSNNMKDAFKHGTRCQKGENNNAAKLNIEQVRRIKKMGVANEISQKKIAEFFGIHQCTVSRLIAAKRWEHI